MLLNNNFNFSAYLWSDNSTAAQLLVDSANLIQGSNTIWLEATNYFGCTTTDTIVITINNTTSIKDFSLAKFTVTPNPTKGKININLGENNLNNARLQVLDLFGKEVLNKQVISQKTALNLSNFSKGIYLVKFSNKYGSTVYKVIKE